MPDAPPAFTYVAGPDDFLVGRFAQERYAALAAEAAGWTALLSGHALVVPAGARHESSARAIRETGDSSSANHPVLRHWRCSQRLTRTRVCAEINCRPALRTARAQVLRHGPPAWRQ